MFASLRARLPQIGRLPRLCVVGICLLLALNSALTAKRSPPRPTSASRLAPVVVAVRDLPAGHLLGRRDVAVARWPATLVPGRARAGPSDVVGRRLAGPVAAREAVTSTRLIGTDLTLGLPAGLVAVPVPLDDASAAGLLRPGDRAELLATPRPPDPLAGPDPRDPSVTTVASKALVLALPPAATDTSTAVVLALTRSQALGITRDRPTQIFTVVGDPP